MAQERGLSCPTLLQLRLAEVKTLEKDSKGKKTMNKYVRQVQGVKKITVFFLRIFGDGLQLIEYIFFVNTLYSVYSAGVQYQDIFGCDEREN